MTSGVGMTQRRHLAGAIYPLDSAVRTEQTPTGWLLRSCLLLGNRARRSDEALARAIDFDWGDIRGHRIGDDVGVLVRVINQCFQPAKSI